MVEPEIPASAPILQVGKRTCALYPRSWVDAKGTTRSTITLAEVVPAATTRDDDGRVVVTGWRRAYKGLNFGLETREEWVAFIEALNAAFSRGLQANLAGGAVRGTTDRMRKLPA